MFGLLKPRVPVRKRFSATVSARLEANAAVTRAAVDGIQFYYHPNFLDRPQCDAMIRMIDADRRPSTLLSEQADDGFRTSESCAMSHRSPDEHGKGPCREREGQNG